MVGNPHRAQISQFELFALMMCLLLVKLDKQFPVEQFEAAVSQSTVPAPHPDIAPRCNGSASCVGADGLRRFGQAHRRFGGTLMMINNNDHNDNGWLVKIMIVILIAIVIVIVIVVVVVVVVVVAVAVAVAVVVVVVAVVVVIIV